MSLSRVFLALIVLAATAANAAPSRECARTSTPARVEALISPQITNIDSSGFCGAAAAFGQHARLKSENALAPTFVRNPFLPTQSRDGQSRSGNPSVNAASEPKRLPVQ